MSSLTHQAIVIGAGPIGLEVAAALKRSGLNPGTDLRVVDSGPIGHTIAWWAPGTVFFSSPERIQIAGVPLVTPDQGKASREVYLRYLDAVAGAYDLQIDTFTRVTGLQKAPEGWQLRVQRAAVGVGGTAYRQGQDLFGPERTLNARHVVLAIGDMHRPRRLDITGENLPHVKHYLSDPREYAGRRVLIVGGKNSAVEAAIRLHRAGARVALSYRRAEFHEKRVKYWLRPELLWLIKTGRIDFHPQTLVEQIEPDSARLRPCAWPDENTCQYAGEPTSVPADDVLLMTGYDQEPTLFQAAGVQTAGPNNAPVFDESTMETTAKGIFVAGTATAGTQHRTTVYIETSHVHADRIAQAITGKNPGFGGETARAEFAAMEES